MHYKRFCGLKEAESAEIDEVFVQRLWFEELYRNPMRTTDGARMFRRTAAMAGIQIPRGSRK